MKTATKKLREKRERSNQMAPKAFRILMTPREHGNADKQFLYSFDEKGRRTDIPVNIPVPPRPTGYFCREKSWQVVPKEQATCLTHKEANRIMGRMKRLGYVATIEPIGLVELLEKNATVLLVGEAAGHSIPGLDLKLAKRIGWLDSVDMPSLIHMTVDEGHTTVCGHEPRSQKAWKITPEIPRKDRGRSNYCSECFPRGNKSLPFLELPKAPS